MSIPDIVGAVGVGILLLAYFLNLVRLLSAEHPLYTGLNALGAGLSGWASWMIGFMPFVVLEATWFIVSVVGCLQSVQRQLKKP
jgi:energy-converting hydrogenase Eha subunit G